MHASQSTGGKMLPKKNTRESCFLRAGFSLLELCVCVTLLSLFAAFSVEAFQATQRGHCTLEADAQLALLRDAMEQFARQQGHYPLPARHSTSAAMPDDGVARSSPFDSTLHRIAAAYPVLIGAVPHATLGLNRAEAMDCWGNKITYAVSEALTSPAGFANAATPGAIAVRTGTAASHHTLTSTAAFVLLSHGRDALGASAANDPGAPHHCNGEAADSTILRTDKQNCDTLDAIFYMPQAHGLGDPSLASFNDDHLVLFERPPPPPAHCNAETVSWGIGCQAPALLTLAGLSVNVTNTRAGFTGAAVSTCVNGTRTTLGVCLVQPF